MAINLVPGPAPVMNAVVSRVDPSSPPPPMLRRPAGAFKRPVVTRLHDAAIVVNPATDSVFAERVALQIEAIRSRGVSLRAARIVLRRAYPDADLFVQRSAPVGTRRLDVWLAFRDGRGTRPTGRDAWWTHADVPHGTVQPSGEFTAGNAACRQLLGERIGPATMAETDSVLPKALIRDLTDPAGVLARHRELTSVTTVRDHAGTPLPVEYHAVRNGSGSGLHDLFVRSLKSRDAEQVQRALVTSGLAGACAADGAILRGARRLELGPGDPLPDSVTGEPWAAMVVSGVARLHLVTSIREPSLTYGTSGSLFGTHLLPGVEWYTLALQSVTESTILVLDPRRIRDAAAADRAVADAFARAERRLLLDIAGRHADAILGRLHPSARL